MVSRLLKICRDPVWQAIGAIVAVIAIFVGSTGTANRGESEISVIHYQRVPFSGFMFPDKRVQLLVGLEAQNPEDIVVNYVLLRNSSQRDLLIADFSEPIGVQAVPETSPILAIESCSKGMNQVGASCTPGDKAGEVTYVPMDWTKSDQVWRASPTLLNAKDQSCVLLFTKKSDNEQTQFAKRFSWSGRIVGANLRIYNSLSDYDQKINPKDWTRYLVVAVNLTAAGIVWFLVLQSAFIAITSYLAMRSGWIVGISRSDIFRFLFLALLATSSSEILVDRFVNLRGLNDQHIVAVPLLFLHAMVCAYLIYCHIRRRPVSA